jgi:hypothetical protein
VHLRATENISWVQEFEIEEAHYKGLRAWKDGREGEKRT